MTFPKISIWSQFRNAAGRQIERYRQQVESLDYPPALLRFYLCEGDSEDDTLAELQSWSAIDDRLTIIQHDTGIPHYAHSTRVERMQAVARNGNLGWDAIARDAWGDYALMIESDLLIEPDLLRRLIDRRPTKADIFAPMIWIGVESDLRFYDLWAYRINGKMFQPRPPTWYYSKYGDTPFELDSVGSVVLFRMALITGGLRLSESECVLGMCNEARTQGHRIFCDPSTNVLHPSIEGVY